MSLISCHPLKIQSYNRLTFYQAVSCNNHSGKCLISLLCREKRTAFLTMANQKFIHTALLHTLSFSFFPSRLVGTPTWQTLKPLLPYWTIPARATRQKFPCWGPSTFLRQILHLVLTIKHVDHILEVKRHHLACPSMKKHMPRKENPYIRLN